jgi:hypothetical protein
VDVLKRGGMGLEEVYVPSGHNGGDVCESHSGVMKMKRLLELEVKRWIEEERE